MRLRAVIAGGGKLALMLACSPNPDPPAGPIACDADPGYTGITLISDQGPIAFDTVGGTLSVDAGGTCVTAGQLLLTDRGADRCRLTLNLSGNLNASGQYTFESAILTADGSCPAFPESLRGGSYDVAGLDSWSAAFPGSITSGGATGLGCYRGEVRLNVAGTLEASSASTTTPQAPTVTLDTQTLVGNPAAIPTLSSSDPCPVPL